MQLLASFFDHSLLRMFFQLLADSKCVVDGLLMPSQFGLLCLYVFFPKDWANLCKSWPSVTERAAGSFSDPLQFVVYFKIVSMETQGLSLVASSVNLFFK